MKKSKIKFWARVNLALIAVLAGAVVQGLFSISFENSKSFDEGRRIVINLPTGQVSMREIKEEPQEAHQEKEVPKEEPLTEQAPPEEVLEEVAYETSGVRLAVIITNMGMNKALTEQALVLPPEVSLSFSPYAPHLELWQKAAVETGHIMMMDLPMEPRDYPISDPGPYALLSHAGDARNLFRLKSVLYAVDGHKGLVAPHDERFTHLLERMLHLIDELKNYDGMFIYHPNKRNHFIPKEAASVGMQAFAADGNIAVNISPDAISAKLAELKDKLYEKESGSFIITVEASPVALEDISRWISVIRKDERITLIPVTHMQHKKRE